MKNPQSQTLFHVSKFETILAILADKGFKTSYCSEEIRHGFNRENKGCISYHYYIPMISFTDMPLSSVPSGDPLVAEMDEIAALVREYEETHYPIRSEEHTSELQSRPHLVCRLLLEKKKKKITTDTTGLHHQGKCRQLYT